MALGRPFLWLLGLTVGGGIPVYHMMNNFDDHLLRAYSKLPLKLISSLTGKIMAVPIPTAMRPSIIGGFARTVNADMSEAVDPDFSNYSTLSDFFTRHLKTGARTFDEHGTSKTQLFSPCDGKLLQIAELTDRSDDSHAKKSSKRISVKNQSFMLSEFLGPLDVRKSWSEGSSESCLTMNYLAEDLLQDKSNNSLYACIIYLSPRDCHRFYSPTSWNVHFARHFRSLLLTVNPTFYQSFFRQSETIKGPQSSSELSDGGKLLRNILSLQERLVLIGQWKHGFFAFSPVGATNVGSISINGFPEIHTNSRKQEHVPRSAMDCFTDYLPSKRVSSNSTNDAKKNKTLKQSFEDSSECSVLDTLPMKLGEEVGYFNLGSTIVLIFEAPKDLKFKTEETMIIGQKIVLD